jgi:SAM-dependent methyltransferase
VEGCDIDPVVLTNPFLDHAEVIEPGKPLPYPDNNFDIVFARSVFEHIEDPEWLARELLRIVKPGGLIAASTPNEFGYFAVAARMVAQQTARRRSKQDSAGAKGRGRLPHPLPAEYRRPPAEGVRGARPCVCQLRVVGAGYHFGKPLVYRAVKWLNKHLPNSLQPGILVYIRKY